MRKFVALVAAASALGGFVVYWRRNPRVGTKFMNSVVDPMLIRRGLAGGKTSEIGTIEHVGRRSGIRRLTPVHPEPTTDGFRIIVPLGTHSEWAHNVLAAGHCRIQLHDRVYALDEPRLIPASEVEDLPLVARRVMGALGIEYLQLRTFAENPGALEPADAEALTGRPVPTEAPVVDRPGEPVASAH